jgi:hypothetical protein
MNTPFRKEEGSYTYKHLLLISVKSYPFLNNRSKNHPPPIGYTLWSPYVKGPHKIVATWFIYSSTIESKMLSKCHWDNIQGLYMMIICMSFTHNIKKKMGITWHWLKSVVKEPKFSKIKQIYFILPILVLKFRIHNSFLIQTYNFSPIEYMSTKFDTSKFAHKCVYVYHLEMTF